MVVSVSMTGWVEGGGVGLGVFGGVTDGHHGHGGGGGLDLLIDVGPEDRGLRERHRVREGWEGEGVG